MLGGGPAAHRARPSASSALLPTPATAPAPSPPSHTGKKHVGTSTDHGRLEQSQTFCLQPSREKQSNLKAFVFG